MSTSHACGGERSRGDDFDEPHAKLEDEANQTDRYVAIMKKDAAQKR